MWTTLRTSTAYWTVARQLKSVREMMFATLRWTKTSPGCRPMISLAGTRLSEHPIHRNFGICCSASFSKNRGCLSRILQRPVPVVFKQRLKIYSKVAGHRRATLGAPSGAGKGALFSLQFLAGKRSPRRETFNAPNLAEHCLIRADGRPLQGVGQDCRQRNHLAASELIGSLSKYSCAAAPIP